MINKKILTILALFNINTQLSAKMPIIPIITAKINDRINKINNMFDEEIERIKTKHHDITSEIRKNYANKREKAHTKYNKNDLEKEIKKLNIEENFEIVVRDKKRDFSLQLNELKREHNLKIIDTEEPIREEEIILISNFVSTVENIEIFEHIISRNIDFKDQIKNINKTLQTKLLKLRKQFSKETNEHEEKRTQALKMLESTKNSELKILDNEIKLQKLQSTL